MAPKAPFKKISPLGFGGFGVVDLVADSKGGRYARKTFSTAQNFPPDLASNVRKRFVREARYQQSIAHKNIVPIVASFLNEEPPYYLMPAADASLQFDLEGDRLLRGSWRAAITDIVAGLEELHSVGMYHRDLKPANVLRYSSEDKRGLYYAVSDFGFISIRDSRLSTLTKTGMAKGSDFYSAPEVVSDLRKASAQSDIYSLGCIIHDIVGVADRIPCREIREDSPFGALLLSCTRDDPKRRFKSVRAVADALVALEEDAAPITSAQAGFAADALDKDENLTLHEWQRITEYLEKDWQGVDGRTVLMKLTAERITEICENHVSEANKLGTVFAQWVNRTAFNFETCDPLANRLEIFIEHCSLEVKSECLLSMLELGTSHNRWYVERKFARLCGPEMEVSLAKRLGIEFRAGGDDICSSIAHLESSISFNRTNLHPILVKTLLEVCP